MTLFDIVRQYESSEGWNACRAVRCLQSGRRDEAIFWMEEAARYRHLAYEAQDVYEISRAAFRSHYLDHRAS